MTNNVIPIGIKRVPANDEVITDIDKQVEYLNSILAETDISFYAPPKPKPPSLVWGYSFVVIMAVLGGLFGHWLSGLL